MPPNDTASMNPFDLASVVGFARVVVGILLIAGVAWYLRRKSVAS